jgi:hypothetical protein
MLPESSSVKKMFGLAVTLAAMGTSASGVLAPYAAVIGANVIAKARTPHKARAARRRIGVDGGMADSPAFDTAVI